MIQQPKPPSDATALLLFTGGSLNDDSQRPLWIYRDHHGSLQGPFSAANMLQWYTTKRLPDSLQVCGVTQQTALSVPFAAIPANLFQPLGSLMASTAAGARYVPLSITKSPSQLPASGVQVNKTPVVGQATLFPVANGMTNAQQVVPVQAATTFNVANRGGQAVLASNGSAASSITAAPLQAAPSIAQTGALLQKQPQQVLLTTVQHQSQQPSMVLMQPQQQQVLQQAVQRQLVQVLPQQQQQQPGVVASRVVMPQPALQPLPGRQLIGDPNSGQQQQVPVSRAVLLPQQLSCAGGQQVQQGTMLMGPHPVPAPKLTPIVSQQVQLGPTTVHQPPTALQVQLPNTAISPHGMPALVTPDLAARQQVAQPQVPQRTFTQWAGAPTGIHVKHSIAADVTQQRLQAAAGPHSAAMLVNHLALGQQPTSTAISMKDLVQLALPGQQPHSPASKTSTASGPVSVGRPGQVLGLHDTTRTPATEVSHAPDVIAPCGVVDSASTALQRTVPHSMPAGSSFDSLQQLAQQASAASGGVRSAAATVEGSKSSKTTGGRAVYLAGDPTFSSTSSLLSMAEGADHLLKVPSSPEPTQPFTDAATPAEPEDVEVVIDDLLASLVQEVAVDAGEGKDESVCESTVATVVTSLAPTPAVGVAASEGAVAADIGNVASAMNPMAADVVVSNVGATTGHVCREQRTLLNAAPRTMDGSRQQRVVQHIPGSDMLLSREVSSALPALGIQTAVPPRNAAAAGGMMQSITRGPNIATLGQNVQYLQQPQLSVKQQVLLGQQQQQERLIAQAQQQQRQQQLNQQYSDQQRQLLLAQQLLQQQNLREQVAQLHSQQKIEQRLAQYQAALQQSAQQQQLSVQHKQQQLQNEVDGLGSAMRLLHNEVPAQQQEPSAALSMAPTTTPQLAVKLNEPDDAARAKKGLPSVANTKDDTEIDGTGTKLFDPFGNNFIHPFVITEPAGSAKASSAVSHHQETVEHHHLQPEPQPGVPVGGKRLTEEQEREVMAALMPELAAMGMTTEQQLAVLKQMLGYKEQQQKHQQQQQVTASVPQQSPPLPSAQSAPQQPQHMWLQQLASRKSAASPAADAANSQVISQPPEASEQEPGVAEAYPGLQPLAGTAAASDGEEEFDTAMLPSDLFDFLDAHNSPTRGNPDTRDFQSLLPSADSIILDRPITQGDTATKQSAVHDDSVVSKFGKYIPPSLRTGPGAQQSSISHDGQAVVRSQHTSTYSRSTTRHATSPPPPGFEMHYGVSGTAGAASAAQSASERDWCPGAQRQPPQQSSGPRASDHSKPQMLDGRSNIIRLFEQAKAAVGAARGATLPSSRCEGLNGPNSTAGDHRPQQSRQHEQLVHDTYTSGRSAGAGGDWLHDDHYRPSLPSGSEQHAAPGAVGDDWPADEDDSLGDEWYGSGYDSSRNRKGWDDPRVATRSAAKSNKWQYYSADEEYVEGDKHQAWHRAGGQSHTSRHQQLPAAGRGRGRGYYNAEQAAALYDGESSGYTEKQTGNSRPTRRARQDEPEDSSLTWQQQQLLNDSAAAPVLKSKAVPVVEYEEAGDDKAAGRCGHEYSRSGWGEQYTSRQRPPTDGKRGYEAAPTPQPSQHLRQAAHSNRHNPSGGADSAAAGHMDELRKAGVQQGRLPPAEQSHQVNATRDNRQQQQPGHHASAAQSGEASSVGGWEEPALGKPSDNMVSPAAAAALAAVQGLKPYCTVPPPRRGAGGKSMSGDDESPRSLGLQLPSVEETKAAVLAALGPIPAKTSPTVTDSRPPSQQQETVSPRSGLGESKEISSIVNGSGSVEAGSCGPPKRPVGSGSLFSSVIGQLRKQATGGTGRSEEPEWTEVSTGTGQDTCPQIPQHAVRSQAAPDTASFAPDVNPPAPSANLSAASSRRSAGDAADIVLAAIQTTRQRSHANQRPKGGRCRQGNERGSGKAGKADAAWREADTVSAWDSGL